MDRIKFKYISYIILGLKAIIVISLLYQIVPTLQTGSFQLSDKFWLFLGVGFIAQLIDGALGMAYGASCNSLLMFLGVPPAVASASIHTAEVFTTGASGLSHLYMKNVDKKLLFRLAVPGVIGSMSGAFLISNFFDGKIIKPYIAIYLMILGFLILIKSVKRIMPSEKALKNVSALGLIGGFMDSVGGGGWGPIVTSNIIGQGHNPKKTIGTVNTAEFFITFVSAGVFLIFTGVEGWQIMLALVLGGLFAAPIGAVILKYIDPKPLIIVVGIVIILTSMLSVYKSKDLLIEHFHYLQHFFG